VATTISTLSVVPSQLTIAVTSASTPQIRNSTAQT
jgi:hypothetical protein